jgi:hypothetical protein
MLRVLVDLVVTLVLVAAMVAAIPERVQAAEDNTVLPPRAESTVPELLLQGKLFCSLKRPVPMPFKGVVTSVVASAGQKVKAGEVLAVYRLVPDVVMQLRRRLCPPQISDLEVRSVEMETRLTSLKSKQTELSRLLTQEMAPEESLKQVKREVQVLERQRALLQERIGLERKMLADDLVLVKDLLSEPVSPAHIPEAASIVSPIDGYVIGIHPELREGAEIGPVAPAFLIGVMDPMIMRAQIHEMEAFRLSLGDKAEITVESLPGRRFVAQVSRTSWTPLTPALEQPSYYEIELTVPNPDLALKDGLKGEILAPKSR